MGKITVYEIQVSSDLGTGNIIKTIIKKYRSDHVPKDYDYSRPVPAHNLLIEKYFFNSAINAQVFFDVNSLKPWNDSMYNFYGEYLGKWSDEVMKAMHRKAQRSKRKILTKRR